jgi:FkbM family methyltransferase
MAQIMRRLRGVARPAVERVLAKAISVNGLGTLLVHVDREWLRWSPRSSSAQRFNWHLLSAARRAAPGRRWSSSLLTGSTIFVELEDQMWMDIFSYEIWEPATTHFMLHWLRRGDVFVDVGANIGYYSLLAAPIVGSEGSVIAFEPQRELVEMIRYSVDRNQLGHVVTVVPHALDRRCGQAVLRLAEHGASHGGSQLRVSGGASLRHQPSASAEELVVSATTLATFFMPRPPRIRLLKIDVEGGELAVLEGGTPLLQTHPPDAIVCEFQVERAGGVAQLTSLYNLLTSFSYRAFFLRGPDVLVPCSSRPSFREMRQNLCFVREDVSETFNHVRSELCARLTDRLPEFLQ